MKPYQVSGSVENPSRSPDLTPLEFSLWSLRRLWYSVENQTLETVREESGISCAAIPVDTLATVVRELLYRNQKRLHANGGRFQHVFQLACVTANLFRGYHIWIMNYFNISFVQLILYDAINRNKVSIR
jgi:hypothetical protein